MIHISEFSGIGGFEEAAYAVGWVNAASCEINPFGASVLQARWPDAYHHDDIHTFTYEKLNNELTKRYGANWRTDDIILTGGFPCQPYSAAGKRKGKEDERHLWPEMLRTIREIAPTWVVGENVRGLTNWNGGLVFEEVCADLEALGYEVQPFLLPAAGVDAPHERYRIWFVAYSDDARRATRLRQVQEADGKVPKRHDDAKSRHADTDTTTNPDGHTARPPRTCCRAQGCGCANDAKPCLRGGAAEQHTGCDDVARAASDTNGDGHQLRGLGKDRCTAGTRQGDERERQRVWQDGGGAGEQGVVADASNEGFQGCVNNGSSLQSRSSKGKGGQSSRPIPPDWQNFPTQPPVCTGDDGFPTESLRQRIREDSMGAISEKEIDKILSSAYVQWRNETIKAAGNAIVHQVAIQIFMAINAYMEQTKC